MIFFFTVPKQSNGYDCAQNTCCYACDLYKIRHEKFTYFNISREKCPLLNKVTKHNLFSLNLKLIDQFRSQLGTLIDKLSSVYTHNRLPNTKILTFDTKDTSSFIFLQYTQKYLVQEDMLLLTTSPFKEHSRKVQCVAVKVLNWCRNLSCSNPMMQHLIAAQI